MGDCFYVVHSLCLPLPSEKKRMSPPLACALLPGLGGQRTEGKPPPNSQPSLLTSVSIVTAVTCLEEPRQVTLALSPLDVCNGIWPQGAELLVPEDWTTRTMVIHSKGAW